MANSSTGTRQNACETCTKAKRACDRQVPRCGRCADRLLQCRYFGRFRAGRNVRTTRPAPVLAPRLADVHVGRPDVSPAEGNPELQLPDCLGIEELGVQIPAQQIQPGLAFDHIISLDWSNTSDNINLPQIPPSIFTPTPHFRHHALSPQLLSDQGWFLHPDSWEIKRTLIQAPADPRSRFRIFVKTAQSWLNDWATTGHNIFIHHHLYDPSRGGLPSCLEDAYLTLTAYQSKTEQTEDMILQILDNRATTLLSQQPLPTQVGVLDNPLLSTRAHLARTQALLIYTLLRLFDGCPRQHALGEDSLPVLFTWAHQMRNSAIAESHSLYMPPTRSFENIFSPQNLLSTSTPSPTPTQTLEQSTLWHAFITSESLRRTWMLVSATLNIYQPRKDCNGNPRCLGFMSFTMRQGLWSAPSARQWGQLVTKKQPSDGRIWRESPTEIVSVDLSDNGNGSPVYLESIGIVDKIIAETKPEELDDFANEIFSMALSSEKIDRWVGKAAAEVFGPEVQGVGI